MYSSLEWQMSPVATDRVKKGNMEPTYKIYIILSQNE